MLRALILINLLCLDLTLDFPPLEVIQDHNFQVEVIELLEKRDDFSYGCYKTLF